MTGRSHGTFKNDDTGELRQLSSFKYPKAKTIAGMRLSKLAGSWEISDPHPGCRRYYPPDRP